MLIAPLVFALSSPAANSTSTSIDGVDPVASAHAALPDPSFGDGASVTIATGVPFIGAGELAWGFGDRFTLGAMIGVTPNVIGVGVRPRIAIVEMASGRLELVAPTLYYPETSDGSPWLLTRPLLAWSHALGGGARAGLGGGVVTASAVGSTAANRPYAGATGDARGVSFWTAVGLHVVVPVGGAALFAEGVAILDGLRLAGDDWVGGPPFTLALGASTHLL